MKNETIIVRRRKTDGKLVRVRPDGQENALPDPGPLPQHSEAAIEAAALSDPDNPPRTPEREKRLKRVPQVKVMRKALGLTQEEFAAHFHIPLGTLRDWEQGKSEPDTCARAYLRVIARNPKAVADALESAP
ncbi:MAG: helix-turn-helix domain-containing protein [Rhodomicrobium sp.]